MQHFSASNAIVRFAMNYETIPGQELKVVGNIPELGKFETNTKQIHKNKHKHIYSGHWNVSYGISLTWKEGGWWEFVLPADISAFHPGIQYKYAFIDHRNGVRHIVLEDCAAREFPIPNPENYYRALVTDVWNHPMLTKISIGQRTEEKSRTPIQDLGKKEFEGCQKPDPSKQIPLSKFSLDIHNPWENHNFQHESVFGYDGYWVPEEAIVKHRKLVEDRKARGLKLSGPNSTASTQAASRTASSQTMMSLNDLKEASEFPNRTFSVDELKSKLAQISENESNADGKDETKEEEIADEEGEIQAELKSVLDSIPRFEKPPNELFNDKFVPLGFPKASSFKIKPTIRPASVTNPPLKMKSLSVFPETKEQRESNFSPFKQMPKEIQQESSTD